MPLFVRLMLFTQLHLLTIPYLDFWRYIYRERESERERERERERDKERKRNREL